MNHLKYIKSSKMSTYIQIKMLNKSHSLHHAKLQQQEQITHFKRFSDSFILVTVSEYFKETTNGPNERIIVSLMHPTT